MILMSFITSEMCNFSISVHPVRYRAPCLSEAEASLHLGELNPSFYEMLLWRVPDSHKPFKIKSLSFHMWNWTSKGYQGFNSWD